MSTTPPPSIAQRGKLTRNAALASVAVATILLALKAWALWRTGSVAVLGSLADTSLDLVASIVTLLGVHWAAQPADIEHRFGHGKAEALASLFQVTLITIAAVGLAWESAHRLISGAHATTGAGEGIGVSLIAILLSLGLVLYQKRVIAKTGSLAIGTDKLHYQSDFYLNLSVIVALVLDQYLNVSGVDPLFGVGIAGWLAWNAYHAASDALDHLMDKEWSVEERQHFLEVASRHPQLHGIHDMRTRSSGALRFVQFHASVDPNMTVREAHDVMDEIEAALMKDFPGVDILIHPDPDGHVESGDDPLRGIEAERLLAQEDGAAKPA
ncbi:cation diffusion facilitator family transporter [Sphingobium sp. DEHP117]|uniref:cation diffusion facilitator family transporter n=1 Tax=Sphingobium sp. DEHP117 TaxID=2993436 RepID=UPI0027D74323|nr:cation diffusion facilitator family transporter [Sphingobium sp. DEHP117]MDQ4421148.1 cation diffusion facilitator family transporter [Sphingobium sp. DEHP117]